MSEHGSRRKLPMRRFPIVGISLWEWEVWREQQAEPSCGLASLPHTFKCRASILPSLLTRNYYG